jgi:hypothetical protein
MKMSEVVDEKGRPMYHTHTARCLESGCRFYVEATDRSQGTEFYKGQGRQYADTEFAAHHVLHPDHLAMEYDNTQFCSEDEEFVLPHYENGNWVRPFCRRVEGIKN